MMLSDVTGCFDVASLTFLKILSLHAFVVFTIFEDETFESLTLWTAETF